MTLFQSKDLVSHIIYGETEKTVLLGLANNFQLDKLQSIAINATN